MFGPFRFWRKMYKRLEVTDMQENVKDLKKWQTWREMWKTRRSDGHEGKLHEGFLDVWDATTPSWLSNIIHESKPFPHTGQIHQAPPNQNQKEFGSRAWREMWRIWRSDRHEGKCERLVKKWQTWREMWETRRSDRHEGRCERFALIVFIQN